MTILGLQAARDHLRVESDYPDAQIVDKLATAEQLAAAYLNRRIFADEAALAAAVAAVPTTLAAASVAYDAARESAYDLDDATAQTAALEYADRVFADARNAARETYAGVVINKIIESAILMTLSRLHDDNRGGADAALSAGARELLNPFRVGLGV